MARLKWDEDGSRLYETGTDRVVLYPTDSSGAYKKGVAWNGITAIKESPDGAEETKLYADNQKYGSLYSAEDFGLTIEAYMSPPEFDACDGMANFGNDQIQILATQQPRLKFGMTYRTLIGNDMVGTQYGYKIHVVYGATASPSEREHSTVNDSPEAETLSWEAKTIPVPVEGLPRSTAHIVIKVDPTAMTNANKAKIKKIEDGLYGTDAEGGGSGTEAKLLMPAEIIAMLS